MVAVIFGRKKSTKSWEFRNVPENAPEPRMDAVPLETVTVHCMIVSALSFHIESLTDLLSNFEISYVLSLQSRKFRR